MWYKIGEVTLGLRVDDPGLRSLFQRYLAAHWAPDSAASSTITASFFRVATLPELPEVSRLFAYAGVRGGLVAAGLRLWGPGAVLELDRAERRLVGWITPEGETDAFWLTHLWFKIGLMEILREAGCFYLHGGAAERRSGAGWLLVGESGRGKSTVTRALVEGGGDYAGDDALLLRRRGAGPVEAVGFPENGSPAFGTGTYRSPIVPTHLAFPEIRPVPKSRIIPLSPGEALKRLLPASVLIFLDPRLACPHLTILGSLVDQCRAFSLILGRDLKENPIGVEKLLGENEHLSNRR